MPFISSRKPSPLMKFAFFASRDEINSIHSKNLNFLFIIYNFKRNRFLALNDIINVRTLRHINDDVTSLMTLQ